MNAVSKRGRRAGADNRRKLTTDQYAEIVRLYLSGEKNQAELAELFDVRQCTVSRIIQQKGEQNE